MSITADFIMGRHRISPALSFIQIGGRRVTTRAIPNRAHLPDNISEGYFGLTAAVAKVVLSIAPNRVAPPRRETEGVPGHTDC